MPAYLIWTFRDITATEGPQRAVAEDEKGSIISENNT